MDPPDDWGVDSTEQLIQNVQHARTMGIVEAIREATAGHEIDAEGQPLDVDLVEELIFQVRGRGHVQREDVLLVLHPAQLYILRGDERLLARYDEGILESENGTAHFHGIPTLRDTHLPKAVVYLIDPQAITMGGQVLYEDRVGRITGLQHPEAYSE